MDVFEVQSILVLMWTNYQKANKFTETRDYREIYEDAEILMAEYNAGFETGKTHAVLQLDVTHERFTILMNNYHTASNPKNLAPQFSIHGNQDSAKRWIRAWKKAMDEAIRNAKQMKSKAKFLDIKGNPVTPGKD